MELKPIDELIDFLYCLRQKEGLPEIPFVVPFDNPENRDNPGYIPFAWHPILVEIREAAREYIRAMEERKDFAREVKQYNPKEELEDLLHDYKKLLGKLCKLSVPAQDALYKHGFNLEHFLTLDRAFFSLPESLEKMQKPGKGRPEEPEKVTLLDSLVQILHLYIGRIPERRAVEELCKAIFDNDCSFDAEHAVRSAYEEPLPSDILLWFKTHGIDPFQVPEGTYRWRLFSEAVKALYDRPKRLRRGAKPLSEEARKKLYRSIWSR